MHRRLHPIHVLLGVALLAGCGSPDEIEVRLVHSRSLIPEDAFERLELRVVDADSGDEVQRGSTGASLAEPVELFDADALTHGRRYVLEVRAQAPGVCRLDRAVGRSAPFEHVDGPYTVSVQVGCADELSRTRARPVQGRLAFGMVTATDGEAVIVGGVSGARNDPPMGEPAFLQTDMVKDVERYDPTTGSFILGGELSTPRAWPGVVPLPDAAVGVLGGHVPDPVLVCTRDVEVVSGLSTSARTALPGIRCLPSVVRLDAGPVLVIGGGAAAPGVAYDAELERVLADDLPLEVMRFGATAVPLSDGHSVLVAGGVGMDVTPMAGVLRVADAEVSDATFEPVAMQNVPSGGFGATVAAYVPCETGGGAVYLLGGQTGESGVGALDDAWCYRDEPGSPLGEIVAAGKLPGPRTAATGVTVPGPEGPRVLVIGGDDGDDTTFPYGDALIVPVDGCSCREIGVPESTPVPMDGLLFLHDAARLDDDSVLVVGGLRGMLGGERSLATGESALFFPDLP